MADHDCDECLAAFDYSLAGTPLTVLEPRPRAVAQQMRVAGFDATTGDPVVQITTIYRNGDVTVAYQDVDGQPIPGVSGFTGSLDTESTIVFATMADDQQANYGEIIELRRVVTYLGDEVNRVAYYDTDGGDVTATVTAAGWEIGACALSLALGTSTFSTTGAGGTQLPAQPAYAAFARITVDPAPVQINGIKYRTDGVAPTTTQGVVVAAGSQLTIASDQFADFLAVPVDGTGQIDGALTVNATVEWFNAAPEAG